MARLAATSATAALLVYSAALLSLRLMGYDVSVVVSDSMRPLAQRGDLLLSRPADGYRAGDVVVFRRGELQVMHRLVESTPRGWRTKGDANEGRDPWLVPSRQITAKAEGVLHALGIPLLLLQRGGPATAAGAFTGSHTVGGAASAGYWVSNAMSWTIYANSSAITPVPPSLVYVNGTGERRIYAATRYPNGSRIHFEGKLSAADAAKPAYAFLLNGCVAANDQISCGWVVTVNNSTKQVTLQSATGNTSRSAVVASCSFAATISLTAAHSISVQKTGTAIYVLVNGVSCLRLSNAQATAAGIGIAAPTGSFTGLMVAGTNRLEASKLSVW